MNYLIGVVAFLWSIVWAAAPLAVVYALNFYVDMPTLLAVFSWIVAGGLSVIYLFAGVLSTVASVLVADEVSAANRRHR